MNNYEKLLIKCGFALIALLVIYSCSQNNKNIPSNTSVISSSKIQYKDSLYIMFTIRQWMIANYDMYHDYSKDGFGIKREDIKYKILKTFYSPDSLKLFCWVTMREPNNPDCQRPQGYSYSSADVIGFRYSLKEPWKLYPLELEKAVCFDSETEIVDDLSKYYLRQMKDNSEYVNKKFLDNHFGGKVRYDKEKETTELGYNTNSPVILKDYGHNLQDNGFWNKSLIWQKGARIPGLYNFQTQGNVTPDDKKAELITPKVVYPDTILKLYN